MHVYVYMHVCMHICVRVCACMIYDRIKTRRLHEKRKQRETESGRDLKNKSQRRRRQQQQQQQQQQQVCYISSTPRQKIHTYVYTCRHTHAHICIDEYQVCYISSASMLTLIITHSSLPLLTCNYM